ncbi:MAG: hypothetical protein HYS81_03145 [Candidatus Aenigmatarchaeota archaeon]|nr:MAG: hypothetical protein HYS81_03145 [Candidatus Aenigmarchaeota archaeon]
MSSRWALVLFAIAVLLPTPASAADGLDFGMDVASIDEQVEAGAKPDYALWWVGPWIEEFGWGGTDDALAKARDAGVIPVIQFFYWGDDISPECLENGCYSPIHGVNKSMDGWDQLARELADHLNAQMGSRPVVIVLETEFNKESVATYEPLDSYMEEKAQFFRSSYNPSEIVMGLGNWGREDWKTWDRAAAASDSIGLQALRGSTRDSPDAYTGLPDDLLDGARKARDTFGKPVFVSDIALSSYPETPYARHQANVLDALFSDSPALEGAGVEALIYRSWTDAPDADIANYYGEGERHFGLVRADGSAKPALAIWLAGVTAERSSPQQAAPPEEQTVPEEPRHEQRSSPPPGLSALPSGELSEGPMVWETVPQSGSGGSYTNVGIQHNATENSIQKQAASASAAQFAMVGGLLSLLIAAVAFGWSFLVPGRKRPSDPLMEMLTYYARLHKPHGRDRIAHALIARDGYHPEIVHEALDEVFGPAPQRRPDN